jgi:hypothetical protein
LCLGAIAAGAGLAIVARRQAEESRLLQQEGQVTEGQIVRLWRGRDDKRQPWAAYRFADQGRTYERNAKVPYAVWKNFKVGTRFSVRYVPARPELSHLLGLAPRPMPPWVPIPVAGVLALGSFLVTLPIRSQRRLLAMGRIAPARVVEHGKKLRTSHGSDLGVKYDYEFRLLSGAIARGQAGPAKKPPAVDSIIAILYDPDSPRKNAPYPFSLVRLKFY